MSNRDQCEATTRAGSRCPLSALADSQFCFSHAPELAATRADARRRGGQGRANVVRMHRLVPPRLVSVYDLLETALRECYEGKLNARTAHAMAALARSMVAVLTTGELEERLRTIEAKSERSEQAG